MKESHFSSGGEREQELAESIVPEQCDFLVLHSRRGQQGPNVSHEFM